VNEGTLGNWCVIERRRRDGGVAELGEDERAELVRLRREVTELRMQLDVLKRSVAIWVDERLRPPMSPTCQAAVGVACCVSDVTACGNALIGS
ncbi:MAG: transposase, partial [Jatrophihabitantaceae bacterium]